jgi:hypothetical protein
MNGPSRKTSRISGAFTYPAGTAIRPHAPVKLGTTDFSYDDNGNMTSDGSRGLDWDAANRLSQVTMPSAAVVTLLACTIRRRAKPRFGHSIGLPANRKHWS